MTFEHPSDGLHHELVDDGLHHEPLNDHLHWILLERIQSCEYPSMELMDRIEQTLSDYDQAARYAHVLFDKITRYPSLHLLDRLAALIARIENDC